MDLKAIEATKAIIEAHSQQPHPPRLIPDSYWVIPGKLAAGEYPRTPYEDESVAKVQQIERMGINHFIDLTEVVELKPYTHLLSDDSSYVRHPIVDNDIPTNQEMCAILDEIHAAVEANAVSYIHCWGGTGRTGTTIGCYLIELGFTAEEALNLIKKFRAGTPDDYRSSPSTRIQFRFVRAWEQ